MIRFFQKGGIFVSETSAELDEEKLKQLKRKIIRTEQQNLRSHTIGSQKMIDRIKKMIEDETK